MSKEKESAEVTAGEVKVVALPTSVTHRRDGNAVLHAYQTREPYAATALGYPLRAVQSACTTAAVARAEIACGGDSPNTAMVYGVAAGGVVWVSVNLTACGLRATVAPTGTVYVPTLTGGESTPDGVLVMR